MLIEVAEVVGTGHEVDFIGGPCEVTDGEFVIGVVLVEKGFEMAVAAFGIKKEVADEGDTGAGSDVKREPCFDGFGVGRAGGGFEINVVFGEVGIFGRSLAFELGVTGVFFAILTVVFVGGFFGRLAGNGRVDVLVDLWSETADVATGFEGGGLVGADEIDLGISFDFFFKAQGPVGAIDDEAPVVGIEEVLGSALGGVENAGLFTALADVVAGPG